MRRIVCSVAMSLDGYIAGPGGEYDRIVIDPDIEFEEIYSRFDMLLMGRVPMKLEALMDAPAAWPVCPTAAEA